MNAPSLAVGIDLGGTNARAALVDREGHVRQVVKRPLASRDPTLVADLLTEAIREVTQSLAAEQRDPPVGIGVAGQILGRSGVIAVGPNLGWRDVPLARLLEERLGRSVLLMNDLAAAAWGEKSVGAGAGHDDVVLVFVGSGVGSGLILDGRLYSGAMGVAGEFGHTKVIPDGRRCGCGENGCLEAYVSGRNLTDRIREALAAGTLSNLGALPAPSASDLEREALRGDLLALELWEQAAQLLSLAIGNLATQLNPARIVLGGGVLLGSPELKRRVQRGVLDYALRASQVGLEVVDAQLGDDAGVVGAALRSLATHGG